ncbi:hypothetical protein [Micromonospora sp. NPDC005652]|uniref:hypothetical protein n=1 Tax=Micromonospora sp. NPDC005652 TaxID=3157046 RepID=UPI0033EF254A
MVTHLAPGGGVGDSDAWGIDFLLLRTSSEDPEEQGLHEELKNLVRKRVATFAAWQKRTENWIKGTGIAFTAYIAVTGTLAVTDVLEHGLWSDASLVGGAALFVGLITAIATRFIGGTLYKLSLGFDHALLLQSKLAAVRGERITQHVNAHLAGMQQQLVAMTGQMGDLAKGARELKHHFLEGGDREASRILERHEEILSGRMPAPGQEASAANVRQFPTATRRLR